MIIILTYKGTRVGRSMNDIKEEKLMDFIKTEMELGRTVHIVPEEKDLFPLTIHSIERRREA